MLCFVYKSRPQGSKDIIKRKRRNQYGFVQNDAKIIKDFISNRII